MKKGSAEASASLAFVWIEGLLLGKRQGIKAGQGAVLHALTGQRQLGTTLPPNHRRLFYCAAFRLSMNDKLLNFRGNA